MSTVETYYDTPEEIARGKAEHVAETKNERLDDTNMTIERLRRERDELKDASAILIAGIATEHQRIAALESALRRMVDLAYVDAASLGAEDAIEDARALLAPELHGCPEAGCYCGLHNAMIRALLDTSL